jgi:transcriptional regulator with XRE-family HTH domain
LPLCPRAHSQPMGTPSPHVMLRRVVKDRGLSHQDLARATGRDRSTVWRWLAVRHPTRPDEASRRILEKLIGIPADAWLTPRERAALDRVAALQPTGT